MGKVTGMGSSFDELIEVAKQLGVGVRHARLGGAGGGLVRVKGELVLFIDVDAEPADQLEQTVKGIARVPGVEAV